MDCNHVYRYSNGAYRCVKCGDDIQSDAEQQDKIQFPDSDLPEHEKTEQPRDMESGKRARGSRKLKVLVFLLITGICLFVIAPITSYMTSLNEPQHDEYGITLIETNIHELTNEIRTEHGLEQLVYSASLSDVARAHSKDMELRGYFDHENPDGHGPADRAELAGYLCVFRHEDTALEGVMGENIARLNYDSSKDVVRGVMDEWMNSPGHRDAILDTRTGYLGVGVTITGMMYHLTQNFCWHPGDGANRFT